MQVHVHGSILNVSAAMRTSIKKTQGGGGNCCEFSGSFIFNATVFTQYSRNLFRNHGTSFIIHARSRRDRPHSRGGRGDGFKAARAAGSGASLIRCHGALVKTDLPAFSSGESRCISSDDAHSEHVSGTA